VPHPFDIDAHGRVLPADEQARRTLADRAGHFEILPSVPDLLVARRSPASGGASAPPRCVLAGDLAAFPIADLVAFIHQSRLSGLLTVGASGIDRAVLFQGGEVRGAHSEASGERIGEVALRLGHLSESQLAEGLEAANESDLLFGKILTDKGFLSSADLWKCLHEQVAAVFHGILLSREGVFTLVDGPESDFGTPLSVNTQALLMDGIRRIDEMSLFQVRIPGPRTYLRRRHPKVPTTLKPVEQELLGLVDGRRSVGEISQAAHLNEFDATKILYHLCEAGYLEVSTGPVAADVSPAERLEALVSGMNPILRDITAALAAAGGLEPFAAGVRAYLADGANRFAPLWRMMVPGKDGTIDAATLLGNVASLKGAALTKLEPSGDPAQLLLEGLRELMLFYLFLAAERLPRDVDERLGRDVKRRFEALGNSA
jgi:hypothetical protein